MSGYKTLLGAAIAAVPALAGLLGYDVAPGFSEQANDLISEIITVVGAVLAIYGRLVATVPGWFAKKPE